MAVDLPRIAALRPAHDAFGIAGASPRRTFGDLDERSRRLAASLAGLGVGPGDVVAVLLENVLEWADVVWAGLRSGLLVAPLSHHLPPEGLRRVLTIADPAAVVVSAGCAELADAALAGGLPRSDGDGPRVPLRIAVGGGPGLPLEDLIAGAPATPAPERAGARIVYTSGTTGPPKAIREQLPDGDAPLRLGPLMTAVGIDRDAVVLSPGPAYHSAPFGFTTSVQRLGGTALSMRRFDVDGVVRAVEDEAVSHLQLVPTMLHRILRDPSAVDRLRASGGLRGIVLGGGACAAGLKAEALDRLGPIVHEYYGASEGLGQTYVGPADAAARPGTVGRPVKGSVHVTGPDGTELAAGAIGRVWFGGGRDVTYEGDDAATAAARDPRGWSTVGDLGHLDEDGFLYLDGRESQVVVTGGVNVHPQHAEDALLAHPRVADATAFGVPDDEWGERLVAILRPVDGDAGDLVADLREHLRAELAQPAARPRELRIVAEVPRAAGGKVDVPAARAAFADARAGGA
ncbi:AMP-binding protein [Patulibacter minatonensis]|uniref:AMP-binding protein n=1 Tax=Patulibacter minatonensis TaxID=298163 RepID=UPI00047DB257|nr:AMP-binding protein [Patulibacter minatonensis]